MEETELEKQAGESGLADALPGTPGEAPEGSPEAVGRNTICKGTKKDGEPCTVQALEDGFCFAHSPSLAEKREEARKKGGFNCSRAARLEKLMPSRFAAVSDMLENVIKELNTKKMDPRTAQAIATVSKTLISVMNAGELEERLRMLEEEREECHDVV